MGEKVLLSVIIPAYNEADNFRSGRLRLVQDFLKSKSYDWEVIVVDDGSTDDTANLVDGWVTSHKHWRLIKNQHFGKAKTVETGMLAANGRVRLFTDFDQATPIQEVDNVLKLVDQGFEIVIGSREVAGATRKNEPFSRHIMGRVFNILVQIIALRGISDSQCGFKAFTKEATLDLFPSLVVYKNRRVKDAYMGAFDVELLFLARKKGYKIAQLPVTWKYIHSTRVSAAKDSLRMLWDIIKIRLAYLQGKYS